MPCRARIQLGQQRRAGMERLGQRLERRAEIQRRQLCLLHHVLGGRHERPRHVLGLDDVRHEDGSVLLECRPGLWVDGAGRRQLARALERRDRTAHVAPILPIDLTARERRAIEQHLRAEKRRARRVLVDDLFTRGGSIVHQLGSERRRLSLLFCSGLRGSGARAAGESAENRYRSAGAETHAEARLQATCRRRFAGDGIRRAWPG